MNPVNGSLGINGVWVHCTKTTAAATDNDNDNDNDGTIGGAIEDNDVDVVDDDVDDDADSHVQKLNLYQNYIE